MDDVARSQSEMENYIALFPDNVQEAIEIGQKGIRHFAIKPVTKVVICGLGGSGIGGLIVSQILRDKCRIPIEIVNDFRVPSWTDSATLVIACSYSGNTEETLSALKEAAQLGAEIACITSGGRLSEIAHEMSYNCIHIPAGQPPRSSLGYNATQQFFILYAYGLIDNEFITDLRLTATLLREEQGLIKSEAAAIANKIAHTTPVIYSSVRYSGVAIRLRQQINENAKMLCWNHVLPEMNHNELVGWAGGDNSFSAIFIVSEEEHPGTVKRAALSKEIIRRYTTKVVDLKPKGNNRLEQSFYLIHLGDWLSLYLAKELGKNPVEIDVIDYLKEELTKH